MSSRDSVQEHCSSIEAERLSLLPCLSTTSMLSGTNASDVREADDDAEEEVPAAVAATGLRTEDKKEK